MLFRNDYPVSGDVGRCSIARFRKRGWGWFTTGGFVRFHRWTGPCRIFYGEGLSGAFWETPLQDTDAVTSLLGCVVRSWFPRVRAAILGAAGAHSAADWSGRFAVDTDPGCLERRLLVAAPYHHLEYLGAAGAHSAADWNDRFAVDMDLGCLERRLLVEAAPHHRLENLGAAGAHSAADWNDRFAVDMDLGCLERRLLVEAALHHRLEYLGAAAAADWADRFAVDMDLGCLERRLLEEAAPHHRLEYRFRGRPVHSCCRLVLRSLLGLLRVRCFVPNILPGLPSQLESFLLHQRVVPPVLRQVLLSSNEFGYIPQCPRLHCSHGIGGAAAATCTCSYRFADEFDFPGTGVCAESNDDVSDNLPLPGARLSRMKDIPSRGAPHQRAGFFGPT